MNLVSIGRKSRIGKGHTLLVCFSLFLGIFPSLATNRAQSSGEAQTKIAVSANLVLVPVRVTDSHGLFVASLKEEDFHIFEEGQLQKTEIFEVGDAPVTVGLIVDHSRSMASKIPDVVKAVSAFAHSSNSQDEMFVVDFNDDVSIELMNGKTFSNDAKDLAEALRAVSARGRTALYDAVSEGLGHLRYGRWEKKALILISDGGDNASHLKYKQVLAQARESQAVIYSIALVGSDDGEENPDLLRRLCKDTGGIAYIPQKAETVESISKMIARDLREQYTLGYVPQNMKEIGGYRKIEVKLTATSHGKLRVRTRPGYSPAAEKASTAGLGTNAK